MPQRGNPYARPDARTRAAKASGYPARSVFKLKELDERFKLLRRGMRVLDLGAAPGSWALYASERVGAEGRVFAVDLSPIEQAFTENVQVIQGDALSLDNAALGQAGPYDLVLSDMAPATSGSKISDQARSFELVMRALEVAQALAKPGSGFVGKLFMSSDFTQARSALAKCYDTVKVARPEGTRSQSSEVFLVGMRRRA